MEEKSKTITQALERRPSIAEALNQFGMGGNSAARSNM